jgi:hypothetical protein
MLRMDKSISKEDRLIRVDEVMFDVRLPGAFLPIVCKMKYNFKEIFYSLVEFKEM